MYPNSTVLSAKRHTVHLGNTSGGVEQLKAVICVTEYIRGNLPLYRQILLMGKIVAEDNKITFWRNTVSERKFNDEYKGGFGNPECWKCEIPVKGTHTDHIGIMQDFSSAILNGTPLLAPGIEGIKGLEISNAIHLSSWFDDWVTLPINEDLFYEKLQEKIKNSTVKKSDASITLNVSGTH